MPRFVIKNSTTASSVPANGSLIQGELVANITDRKLWVGNVAGNPVQLIGSLGSNSPSNVQITGGTIGNGVSLSANLTRVSSIQLGSVTATSVTTGTITSSSGTSVPTTTAVKTYVDALATGVSGGVTLKAMYVYGTTNTYTKSGTDVKAVRVMLVGAGGGGSRHGESGGGGGYAERVINADLITGPVTVTIGIGTGNAGYSNNPGQGGTTSFGAFLSATGGNGANSTTQHCGGEGGLGSGGDMNLRGGGGRGHNNCHNSSTGGCNPGGDTFFGGSIRTFHGSPSGGTGCPGTGGASGDRHQHAGTGGMDGYCVVYEYK